MHAVTYCCGDVRIDVVDRRVTRQGTEVTVEPKAFAVILQLLARPGTLVTRNELLDAVWGHRYVAPSTLNRVIALARRAFVDDPELPKYIQTVHGAGYRYIGPIDVRERSPGGVGARFAPPVLVRLPARIESLIGREAELATLDDIFRTRRAVTVLGTGGIGKTQCALEAARAMAKDFRDGVWFFDLIPARLAVEWLQALAIALAVSIGNPDEMLGRILPVLQGRRLLIVLDNCDRIAAEVGAIAFSILRATDEVKILATSQAPLNFTGEQVMRMPPLGLPACDDGEADVETIAAAPAVRMLLHRIGAVQPGFAMTTSNAAVIAEICRRLDGMPLALELAAARFALLSPDQVLQRLHQRFRFLSSDSAGRDPRHGNLLSLLDWSFSLLSAQERRLLLWCSVFVQGWTIESAVGLSGPLATDPETIIDLLSGLVRKSLVSAMPIVSPPRYQLLETVREYALEQLRDSGEEAQARAAHLSIVMHVCQAAQRELSGTRMRLSVEQLNHEHGNIAAALEYGRRGNEHGRAAALGIVGALTQYVKAHGVPALAIQWCDLALENMDPADSLEYGRAQLCRGVAIFHARAGGADAQVPLSEAARVARLREDLWTEAYASGFLAMWHANRGRPELASVDVDTTARIAQQLDEPNLRGLAGLALGWKYFAERDFVAAISALVEVRLVSFDLHQQHFIDIYIGLAHFGQGHLVMASREWLAAMRGAMDVGNVRGVSGSVEGCGYIAERLGRHAEAARFLASAAQVRERSQCPLFNFWVPHHDRCESAVRANLAANAYESQCAAGRRMRPEAAAEEARLLLESYARTGEMPVVCE